MLENTLEAHDVKERFGRKLKEKRLDNNSPIRKMKLL